jgi:photosystem II stability/assembly factor-like uncharacterized protein
MITKSTQSLRFTTAFLLVALVAISLPLQAFADGDGNVFRDPAKFSDWTVVGPNGGDVRVVTIDPRDKNRLYISTLDGQIHTSADGGRSWRLLVNLNRPQLILDQLLVDSRDSKIIYTSGHRYKAAGGFFRTTDGGATWKESKELRNESIHSMTQSAKDPNILVVGTLSGIWISKNSGEDWEKVSSSTMPINIDALAIDPRNSETMYAGTWWRAYKTTDAGKNWRLIKDGMIDDSDVFAVTLDPRDANHIIASACSGIYESTNAGERWAKIQGIPSQSRRTRDIVQHPTIAGTIYAATTEGFWMSTNGGKSWILTTQRNLEINSIAVHPDEPNRIFIGTNNYGVMVSNDGGRNFAPTNDNFTSRFAYSITPDVEQPNRLYATTHNTATAGGFFFLSDDGGQTWQQGKNIDVSRVSPFTVLQSTSDPNTIYLGTNIGVFKSIDRGVTFNLLAASKPVKKAVKGGKAAGKGKTAAKKPVADPEPAPPTTPALIPALSEKVKVLAFTEDGKNGLLAGTDTGLYRSYDVSKGWEKISLGDGISQNIFALHISSGQPGQMWVGTETSGVLVSNDDGTTWRSVGGAPKEIPVSSIAVDPKRPNYVYVGNTQSLYLSRDGGQTWTRRGGNLPLGNYTSILINPANTDEIFVSSSLESDGGIYFSDNAGMKWKRIDSKDMKIPSRRVWTMAFDPTDPNRIFAASHSSGIYRIDRTVESSASAKSDVSAASGN